ncbi:hypothetical protein BGW80DRAFT_1455299 [Lactifluus volemus]|nr:hypothetical protein BGW80DRAFT_1455299 [Lactifluus volemus]
MSYPPILDLQSFNKAKDDRTLEVPGAAEAINAAVEVVCKIPDDVRRGHRLGDGSDVPPPSPELAWRGWHIKFPVAFYTVCTGTPVSQPTLHTLSPPAEDGKVFWVEFAPQFHAHLVKCAVALVPRPLNKVKKVMFGYILELLNGEGPQAFFDLSKGQRVASLALKEKRRLARKRNRASRQERRKAAAEAANGKPQRSCKYCKRDDESGEASGKGKSRAAPKPNKPAPRLETLPPTPQPTIHRKKKKKSSSTSKPQEPTTTTTTPGPRQSAATHVPNRTLGRVLASDQPYEMTSDRPLIPAQHRDETQDKERVIGQIA